MIRKKHIKSIISIRESAHMDTGEPYRWEVKIGKIHLGSIVNIDDHFLAIDYLGKSMAFATCLADALTEIESQLK
jgi:hypothetical protein